MGSGALSPCGVRGGAPRNRHETIMSFLIPWRLLEWARDNRVLRIRWFGLEAEFVQPVVRDPLPLFEPSRAVDPPQEPPAGLPSEERERRRREQERAEAEKLLYHSA